jgi:aldehyde dehydrogenase (NAD+)
MNLGVRVQIPPRPFFERRHLMVERFKNYINGEWVEARSGKTFLNINPADTSDVVGEFPKSDERDIEDAVRAATLAFDKWRKIPAPRRAEFLIKVGEKLIQQKEEIAKEMTREMGKVLKESRGDVQEGIDTAYLAAGEGRRLFGFTTPSELPNKFAMCVRAPVGVCGIITPWNFPMAIPTWKIFPALIAGNTVVFKPASDVPKSGTALVKALEEVGLPPGVINLVHGTGGDVGVPLARHKGVSVVSFTGSSDVGREINGVCGGMLKRVSCELGGKNAQIVMDDADIDLAIEGALWGAFGTTGQRCTATSRLILHKKIKDEFLSKFIERTKKLKLGNGLDPKTDVGPVVNKGRIETIQYYVDIGIKEGAKLLLGGKQATDGDLKKGYFYEPTIFDNVTPEMTIAKEEIFGPVISILTVESLEEAIRVMNSTDYGLSGSIYTRDVNNAFKAIEEVENGVFYINAATIGAEVHLPFGGYKNTGNGHREGSHTVYDVFTEWKTVYIDYSGRLQKAQLID